MCDLDKELLYWLPAALREPKPKPWPTMSETVPYSASFAAVVDLKKKKKDRVDC